MIAAEIPVLDFGPHLAGTRGAREDAALALGHALEHVGFYFVVNHGVPRTLVDDVFAEARRFHALTRNASRTRGTSVQSAPAGRIESPSTSLSGSSVVNSGDILKRWTNDRFLSTEHRVRASAGRERYAIPFCFDPRTDFVMECLPTCQGPDNPPRYPPITYERYLSWFMGRNYHGLGDEERP